MKTRIFNLIILDESGSMESIRKQAVDSVNETVQTIRKAQKQNDETEQFVSFVTFNDDMKTVSDCVPADEVKELSKKDYTPDGCTALYDAMGLSISHLRSKIETGDRVLVTIVTDGYENASRHFNVQNIKELVSDLKKRDWVFVYIGANHDVEKVAMEMNIGNVTSFTADAKGVEEMTSRVNTGRRELYDRIVSECFCSMEEDGNFFAPTEKSKKDEK